MLESLSLERGPAGGGAQQEAPARASAADQIRSPTRWKPNIE
jgi:hypothetical protein